MEEIARPTSGSDCFEVGFPEGNDTRPRWSWVFDSFGRTITFEYSFDFWYFGAPSAPDSGWVQEAELQPTDGGEPNRVWCIKP